MRTEKKKFKTVFIVDEIQEDGHAISLDFPTKSSAMLYEKLISLDKKLNFLMQEDQVLTEEEQALLDKLQKKQTKK